MASVVKDRAPEEKSGRATIMRLFDDTRRRLVETGTRNRLVHVNRSNTRGNVLNVVNERSNDVYAILSGGKAMRFLAIGQDVASGQDDIHFGDSGATDADEGRFTDDFLETRLGPDALQKKLLKIAREAQTAEEESGVNILYLALGFLTWFEDKSSSAPREAPLVLLPVELVRNARTSTYDVRVREDDIMTNLPLQQRLKDDFGIDLPEIDIDEDWRPSNYFAAVGETIASRARWKVDADGIQLGFFSFSKQLMYRDLDVQAWSDEALADHPLTRGLLFEGFDNERPMFSGEDRLDDLLPPERLFHVVDADASQAKVIEEVRSGHNLVVQGPPGTGKSQTITNIIASAVRDGKRVLFVAEKMAALSVVHDRLVKVGLRDICLELHSRTANKKAVLSELGRTITQASTPPGEAGAPTALRQSRDRLNAIATALHAPIDSTGETPFTVLSRQARFIGQNVPTPTLAADALAAMSREVEAEIAEILTRYGALLAETGAGVSHPFEGTRNLNLQPVELARLPVLLKEAVAQAETLVAGISAPISHLNLSQPIILATAAPLDDLLTRLEGMPAGTLEIARALLAASDLPRLQAALGDAAAWRADQDRLSEQFVDAAFTTPVSHLRAPLVAGTRSFFARLGGAYRRASRELAGLLRGPIPKAAAERVALVDALVELASKRASWRDDEAYCANALGDAWRGERTDFHRILATCAWCSRLAEAELRPATAAALELASKPETLAALRKPLRDRGDAARSSLITAAAFLDLDIASLGAADVETTDLNTIASRFATIANATDRYESWAQLERHRRRLEALGVAELAERMRAGSLDGPSAVVELQFARAERLWQIAMERHEILRDLRMEERHALATRFAQLERERLKDNVTDILAAHLAQVPQGAQGEMGVIRSELAKKKRHLPIRKLFERAGTAIQRIKPVLLMSPISVAQFLPPNTLSFDLLVIDEASQVRPEDALGAIARAQQIVVVGDQKQLPPSSFFDRLSADPEEDEDAEEQELLGGAAKLAEMESVLTLCEARGLGSRMLQWHYRSRDPSLIQVSNREFYEDKLILPPSPLQQDPSFGLCFTRVDGAYDKGGKRDNRKEGEAIVARVAEHARQHPTLSLGIVTFSFAQRNLITELLELARRSDAKLDAFLREGQAEDVFVKNIENVQGDERDVILVSVGYGPTTPGGRLTSMSFGPVNGEGGERRLNVLFTRARIRCEVCASFDPGDIDVSRTAGEGPRILKRYLEFAKNGQLEEHAPTGLDADSPFEEDVADIIRNYGFIADPQVGSAGFRIDLGVRHPDKPGTYILAVECDGATYHSALWARERDRLRQDVLEHLGWRFHRIWSTDWFYNRAAEIERLRQALIAAKDAAEQGIRIDGANRTRPAPAAAVEEQTPVFEIPAAVERQMPAYERAVFPTRSDQEPHEVSVTILADLSWRIVEKEGPIHLEEVARRIAACFGKEKAGSRIVTATKAALAKAQRKQADLLSDGTFWFTRAQSESPPVRDRSNESGATTKCANISMLEIQAALELARQDNAGGSDTDLIRTAARLMGFKRVGSDLQARIAEGM
ncbi:DUF3320 domain-containing protein [Sphingomonas elodea]|uniref:DUF3320 domain-containing protein n=1 Tax=Sphingomonas elodea TaxID=179878 RepID=UPI001ED91724|nr:DUF3320 domain-containing protein [Sphingomonas elodea]